MPHLTVADFWILFGVGLSATATLLSLRRALRVTQPLYWDLLGPLATYHGFAWTQLGAALAFAVPSTAGLMPLVFAVFDDLGDGTSLLLIGAALWGAFAIVFYFATAVTGFIGYLRFVRTRDSGRQINVFSQFIAVMLLSMPLMWLFVAYLAPLLVAFAEITARSLYMLYLAPI